jgi:TolB-like protein/DNA-binding winged helix-turn-helix (wHTH) protein/Tfp pilus assembly protein PilF
MQISFGEFTLDLASRELRRGVEPVRLSPKAFQLLEILVTNRPKALSKAELQDRLWPRTFVVEKNLANLVSEIRQALGDSPSAAGFIRTVPRFGYAFQEAPAPAEDQKRRWLALAAGGFLLVAIAASAAVSLIGRRPHAPERIALAVLPFENLTGDPEQDYLCDGLTEEMIAHIAELNPQRLGVIARTSVKHYKSTTKRADAIGRELGVAYLLETSLRRVGNRVRITVQLVDARSQGHVWVEHYEHDADDILALQRDVAAAVTRRTASSLGVSPRQSAPTADPKSQNTLAYEQYLRGRYHWGKNSIEGLRKAQQHFQKAIELDSSYARAYSGLAETYALLGSVGLMPIAASHPLGRAAALRALDLDDSLAEAHRALAAIIADHYWDWAEAERHFKRAIELGPNDATTLNFYSFYLACTARAAEALPIAQLARRIDPVSAGSRLNLGVVLYLARRFDEAAREFEEALDLDSNHSFAHVMLGLAQVSSEQPERAVAEVEAARALERERQDIIAFQAYILARAGRRREALVVLDDLQRVQSRHGGSPFLVAIAYTGLDDNDRAIEWLEKAISARSSEVPTLKASPLFDKLRLDPRYAALVARVGLP